MKPTNFTYETGDGSPVIDAEDRREFELEEA